MIRILVDSAADFSKKEIEEKGIHLVPLQVNFQEEQYLDGVNLERDEFYEKLVHRKDFPKTSQPSPQEFLDVFEEVKEKGDELICILLSSALSGTYQSAHLARSMADYDKIYIVDSLSAVVAIRILCDTALRMAEHGNTAQEIIEELEELKGRIQIFAAVDTLEYLAKGGRISKAAATIGDMANLKPIITVSREGTVEVVGKGIGVNRTLTAIQKKIAGYQIDENYPVYSLFSYGEENCVKLEQKMEKNGCKVDSRKQIGPAIGTHIGPEAFGVCFVEKK